MKSLRVVFAFLIAALLLTCLLSSCSGKDDLSDPGTDAPGSDSANNGDDGSQDKDSDDSGVNNDDTDKNGPQDGDGNDDGDDPQPLDRFADGAMIYYEGFDSYGDVLVKSNNRVLSTLRANGVWKLDDKASSYYEDASPYTESSTCKYEIRDGKLHIMGHRDWVGSDIKDPKDTYLVVLDENTLWELEGREYTIQYDLNYESFTGVTRYIAVVWNYYGEYYNSFHLRVNGTGKLQGHYAGQWIDHDKYVASTDLYAASTDKNDGTSIANKLLGIDLAGNSGKEIFKNIPLTVRIQVSESGAATVLLSTDGENFVKVTEYRGDSPMGDRLNFYTSRCNGGALAIKTGAGINGTIDNLMVYMGHGEEPEDKTVTFSPKPVPEAPGFSGFTQERTVLNTLYNNTAYSSFNAVAKAEILIPGLKQGMIPQGMDVSEEKNLLFISGYFKDKLYSDSSVILTVDLTSKKLVGQYYIQNSDGSDHTSHVGGLAVTDKNLYISNGGALYRIPLSAFDEAGNIGTVRIVEAISVPTRASFCNYSGGILWVGDFYMPDSSYSTPTWRHMTNRAGGQYKAWCVGYRLTDETQSGIKGDSWSSGMSYATPDIILSIDQKIQGFAVVGDKIALSASYGYTKKSNIFLYENVLNTEAHTTKELNGKTVPVWFLDSTVGVKTYTNMPMSEALAAHNGSLFILYESGATGFSATDPTDHVFKMKIS